MRLGVLQGDDDSFGLGITSNAIEATGPPDVDALMASLRAYPELEAAAGEALYQTIANRATVEGMRMAALDLRATLQQWLAVAD